MPEFLLMACTSCSLEVPGNFVRAHLRCALRSCLFLGVGRPGAGRGRAGATVGLAARWVWVAGAAVDGGGGSFIPMSAGRLAGSQRVLPWVLVQHCLGCGRERQMGLEFVGWRRRRRGWRWRWVICASVFPVCGRAWVVFRLGHFCVSAAEAHNKSLSL